MATKTDKEGTTSDSGRGNGSREALAEPVGEGLRKHRQEAGMSLRALAREVGVSPSLISQIEHGKATPSVATLYAIVSELGISLDELFFDQPRGAAAVPEPEPARAMDPGDDRFPSSHWQAPSEGPVLRSGNRLSLTLATGVRWERLTASHDPGVEFLYCTYPVGGESAPADDLMTHSGSEYGIILEGRCGATVGEDYYELETGDSIAFDSRTPHRIWNLNDDRPMVAILTVVGRDGDPRVS
ncbi:MAG TPA: XRE family transcriptional regulator [Solirubrobacterales bacterium]|nr:XRE family transcriptional regulator [Solirubrobacterales bacterium]